MGRNPSEDQPPRGPRPGRGGRITGAVIIGVGVIVVAIVALTGGLSSSTTASTVTYVASGSSANVTYGPSGSSTSAGTPLRETDAIPAAAPAFYAVTAQLQGDGQVSCEIEVNGTVISQATAFGGYEVARCEILRDASGNWTDANAA